MNKNRKLVEGRHDTSPLAAIRRDTAPLRAIEVASGHTPTPRRRPLIHSVFALLFTLSLVLMPLMASAAQDHFASPDGFSLLGTLKTVHPTTAVQNVQDMPALDDVLEGEVQPHR